MSIKREDRNCSNCKSGPARCNDTHCIYGQQQMGDYPGWQPKPEATEEAN